MSILVPPEQTWFDNDGNILSNGLIYTYIPGTSTPAATYQDDAQTVQNENPVQIDVFGRTLIYGTGNFRFIVTDANNVTIYDQNTSSFLESNAISTVMGPVNQATTLALARTAMGIDDEIATSLAAVSLVTGPTGPQGIQGNQGNQGNQGPIGPTGPDSGGGGGTWDGTGTPPIGYYVIAQFLDFNPEDDTPFGTLVAAATITPVAITFDGTWRHMGYVNGLFNGIGYVHSFLALRVA